MNRLTRRILSGIIALALCWTAGFLTPEIFASDNAEEPAGTSLQLSIEDAVNRALQHSYALRMAEYSVEQGEDSRNSAASEVNFIPASGDNEEAARKFTTLVQKDLSWMISKKNLEIEKDSLSLEVYQCYCDVLAAQEKVRAQELALEYADYKRLAAQVGLAAGTTSKKDLETAKVSCSNQVSGLAQSKSSLEQCRVKLNELLGLSAQERPVLTEEPEYLPLEISDLEVEIIRRLDSSPALWKAEQEVYLAELSLDLHSYTNMYNYNSAKIDVSKAELSAEQSKIQARQNLRSMYDNICNLQEQYSQQQQALVLAENDMETARLRYEMGMISKGDVLAMEADLAAKRQGLKSLIYQQQLLRLNFYKPWA